MHNDNLAIMRICNDCKMTFITQSSIEEHIKTTGHKDIVKTNSGIIKTQFNIKMKYSDIELNSKRLLKL
jgi:hypothetical protein